MFRIAAAKRAGKGGCENPESAGNSQNVDPGVATVIAPTNPDDWVPQGKRDAVPAEKKK